MTDPRAYPDRPFLAVSAAVIREVREETALTIEPVTLAGYREMVVRDGEKKVARHFVILCFASRWISGVPFPDLSEISEADWRHPDELTSLKTTQGLQEIVAEAMAKLK